MTWIALRKKLHWEKRNFTHPQRLFDSLDDTICSIDWAEKKKQLRRTIDWAWNKSACQSLEWDNLVSRDLYLWALRVVIAWWTGWRSSDWEEETLRKSIHHFGEILWWAEKKSPYFGRRHNSRSHSRRWIMPVFFCVRIAFKTSKGRFWKIHEGAFHHVIPPPPWKRHGRVA